MRIMLDFDSVTGDLQRHLIESCNTRFGTNYQSDDITSWDWWSLETPTEHAQFVWGPDCFNNQAWTLAMPPVEGAIDGIERLLDEGHAVTLVSDRSPHMGLWLKEWLRKYGLAIPVHTTNRHKGPTKLDVIRKLGLEVVIEDAPHHAVEMSASGLVQAVFLLDKPWNQDVGHRRVIRCFGWEHLLYGRHRLYVGN